MISSIVACKYTNCIDARLKERGGEGKLRIFIDNGNWICAKCVFRPLEEVVAKKIKQQWDPDHQIIISPLSTPASGSLTKRKRCIVDDPMDFVDVNRLSSWNLHDLTAAGKLLRRPPLPCQFDDEHEMRRVYSMIYDVYRCKWLVHPNKKSNYNRFATCLIKYPTYVEILSIHSILFICVCSIFPSHKFRTEWLLWHRLETWFLCVISESICHSIWFDCQFQKRSWQIVCHWFYCKATRNEMKRNGNEK